MLRLIEVHNYGCLKNICQPLDNFHVLVGPNASGKTTFLDVVSFLGDFVSGGLEEAVFSRTNNFQDLVWMRSGESFDLAIELDIPPELKDKTIKGAYDVIRCNILVGIDEKNGGISILKENVSLMNRNLWAKAQAGKASPDEVNKSAKRIINRDIHSPDKEKGRDTCFIEEDKTGVFYHFNLPPEKSALANLPEDESKFPVALWLKSFLTEGVQPLMLNSVLMRKPSPPGQPKKFKPDGSNLPWVIEFLRKNDPPKFQEWVDHLRTALSDLKDVRTVLRPEDKHRYIVLLYENYLEVPSWMVSDGTLRILALTLPAYIQALPRHFKLAEKRMKFDESFYPELDGIYLIEEPENGLHPQAIETVYQSLSSVYGAQVLLATHSPVILGLAKAKEVLCFSRTEEGATQIIRGDQHPALKDWKGVPNLSVLFASGVLG